MSSEYGPLIDPPENPLTLFASWFAAAQCSEMNDPNAMTLATVGADGQPSARMVLLKEHGPEGFTFYTNTESRKGQQLAANCKAALLFHWKSLHRQVRLEGCTVPVSDREADAYFATRPCQARLGAWASQQSRSLPNRQVLEQALIDAGVRFEGKTVPRPPYWSGFRLQPLLIEFWQEQLFRLHDRVIYTRTSVSAEWTYARQYP